MSHVTEFPAAASTVAVNHFLSRLSLETDCADVHESMRKVNPISSYSTWWENRRRLHVVIFRGRFICRMPR